MAMKAVIMAGGSGTRLWPMSRKSFPKQLQKLVGDKSMIQETFDRLEPVVGKDNIYISTTEKYKEATRKTLIGVNEDNYLIEPNAKNTAPAIGLITAYFYALDPKTIIATVASDHVVTKTGEFQKVLGVARDLIIKNPDQLVTVGLNPTYPETGMGYIKMNGLFTTINNTKVFSVEEFVEKPDLATAKKYLSSWEYLWNASYFIFRADHMMNLFKKHQSKIYTELEKIVKLYDRGEATEELINEIYQKMPEAPIDTAIIEKAKDVLVIPADLGWNDVGSWASLYDVLSLSTGSSVISKGHHIGVDDENILVYSGEKMIATVGLDNIVIVDTPDVTLICNKNHSQDIKKLIEKLKDEGKHLYL